MNSNRRLVRPSAARDRALSILHPTMPLAAEEFAHYMWPLSPSWQRAKPGGSIRSKALGFLRRLRNEGLVEDRTGDLGVIGFVVSPDGIRLTSGWSCGPQ